MPPLAFPERAAQSGPVPRVVIVGGGFGGLAAARRLAKAPVHIMLIDRQNHHCFQPLLYQVATASLAASDIAWPIRSLFKRQRNISIMLAEVMDIDLDGKRVRGNFPDISYDYLVVAAGMQPFYFGHGAWEAFAPGLKSIEDALHIRNMVLSAFEKAEYAADESARRKLMTFAIIGGGPTGVELAGAVAEIARKTLRCDFRSIQPEHSRILLIEAGPRLLPAFPEGLADYAAFSLRKNGVEILLGRPVTGCDADGIALGEERIHTKAVIWAAGVHASSVMQTLEPRDRQGRIRVAADLSLPGHPNVFIIGDAAAVMDGKGRPVPGIAPAAKQMGEYAARLITARLLQPDGHIKPFQYRHYGDLATISRKSAIVNLKRLSLTGFTGWLFWSVAHIYFLIGARNRFIVAVNWLWNYLTFQRGARIIINSKNYEAR
jgi:NADH dehydrogenase